MFDIDKLYLASLAYNVKDNKASIEFDKDTKQYHQNKLLENYMTLLKDNENSIQIAMRSIDNDTELVESIANQFESAGSTKTLPYNFYTLHEQTDRRRDYITGKLGIAPFALNVTNQALTMAYGVKLKESEFTKQTPFKRIDLRDDKNGNAVMSWLSAFINAHCDIVKDPYVSKINVNSFTYNMLNFLVRTGQADNSVWFITQPIIKDMAFAAEAASGHYGRDLTKSKYRAQKDAIEKALRQYIVGYLPGNHNINDQEVTNELRFINSVRLSSQDDADQFQSKIQMLNYNLSEATSEQAKEEIRKEIEKTQRQIDTAKENSPSSIINRMFKSEQYLKHYALKYTNKEDMLKDPDFCRAQVQVYKAWNILQPFVDDISKLVQLTKIDTKKQGNTLAKQLLYKEKYDQFLKDIQQGNTSFEPEGVMKMMTHSWIDKKTNSFMKAMKSILAGQVFEATTSYTSLVGQLGQFMNNYSQTEDIANKLDRNISQCIKSLFIRAYAKDADIDVNKLFFGNNTIADRLANIKRRINNPDDKLFYLRNNKLLTSLVESDQVKDETTIGNNGQIYPAPKFVSTFHSISESSFNQDDLTDAWDELLDYPDDQELKEFARDLVVYAWLTSGEKSGFNRFFKYVPNSWKIKSGFVGHVEFWLNKFNTNLESDVRNAIIDDILRNNWNDTDFVPQYDYIRKNQRNFTDSGIYDPQLMKPFALCGYTQNGKGEWVTTINRLDNGQYPRYITVKDELATKDNNNSNRSLYRLVGVSKFDGIKDKDTGNTSLTEVPIYALCKKRGLHFKGNDIFEFGNSDFEFGMNYIGYQENDAQYAKLIEQVKQKFYIDAKKLEPEETKTESPVKNTDVTTVRPTGKSGGITYNKEQQSAIINAVSFLKTNTDPTQYYVIEGKAGTGKTTIAKEILKEFDGEMIYIAAVSHKAKGVIKNSFGDDIENKMFFSIAGLLGMKGFNDNSTQQIKFVNGEKIKLLDSPPAILVIDEASMITEDVLNKIITINEMLSRPFQMLFLGDIGQIQPIRDDQSEFYRTHKDLLNKKSDIFNSKHKSKLVTRVRQGEANPILPYADYFWENSQKESPELNPTQHIVRNNQITDKGSLLFSNSEGEILNSVIKAVKNAVEKGITNHIKIVTYHVNEKSELNNRIHEALFGKDSDYSKGDMLILNAPYDLPDTKATIENSAEIQVKDIPDTDVDEYGIHTLYLETTGTAYTRTGQEIKDCTVQVVSRQDIEKYNHKLAELASVAKRYTNKASRNQAWKEFWEYKGRYADVDFGYAITAHKSQGSTYDIVVVDEKDIMGTSATSNQEKSELIYTALTRPRNTAIVISSVPVSNPYTGDIENPSLPKQTERKIEYHPGNWTRQEVNDNPDVLYVFGDNTNRTSGSNPISNDSKYARAYGLGKMFPNATAAIIRGMDNAMPVSTQHWYDPTTGRTRDAGRWNDSDIEDFKKVIDAEFQAIKDEWDTGKYRKIYLPSTGLSNGKISQITEARTPVLFKYLYDKTADLAKYVSTEHKDTQEKSQSTLQNKQNNNPQDYTMNSGGAYGGDTYWDVIGRRFGLTKINHFRPIDNQNMSKTLRDGNVKPFSITHEQSNYAREQIKQLTGRELPYTLAGELLARDFYQVDKSDGVFAIANITSSQKAVEGGTNMAVQVGIKQGKPVHVYDLNTESWYQYNQSTGKFEVENTPVLTKSFAGVGTRNIQNYKVNKNGQWVDREGYVGYDKALKAANAIKAVYQKTFNNSSTSNTVNIHTGNTSTNNTENKLTKPESLKNFEEAVIDGDKVLKYNETTRFGSTGHAIKYKNGKYFITKTDWGKYFWHEANEFELRALEPRSLNFSTSGILQKEKSKITLKDYLKYIAMNNNDINIYAGTNENYDLSNFAIRPFTHYFNDGSVKEFQSVEQAFQYIKASKFADTRSNDGNTRPSGKSIQAEIMGTTSGLELRSLGRQIKNLNVQAWDRSSSFVMKQLLKESFEQNPQALQRLLNTGNATLTHVQDNSKWGKEFPRLLMEVREELRKKQDSYKVKNDQDIKDDLKELGKRRQDDCNK